MTAISDLSVPLTNEMRAADRYLGAKHNLLTNFASVEDLVCDGMFVDEENEELFGPDPDARPLLDEKDRDGLTHHIGKVRSVIARTLWSHEYYVSTSLIDEFVLEAARTGTADVPNRTIARIAEVGLDRPGFVLYPLIGFHMKEPMLLRRRNTCLRSEAVFRKAGFAVSLQTNSQDMAIQSVQRLARSLGIRDRISRSDLQHFARTVSWFGRNPLMIVKLTSHSFQTYENQFIYTLKIRLAAVNILMLHALSGEVEPTINREHGVTWGANNFSTLDIRHYAVGEAFPGRPIELRRVPMNVAALDLARLSDVAATLATDVLAAPAMKRHQRRITKALRTIERGYFRHVNMTSKARPERRLYMRLVTALDWFRQSFSARANGPEATVAVAVALETLLTDHYAPNVIARLRRRLALCLPRAPDRTALQDSVEAIYIARSEIVHSGAPTRGTDMQRARLAFIGCFCAIAERLPHARLVSNGTLGHLLGDTIADDSVAAARA